MHQNQLHLRLCCTPQWGSLQHFRQFLSRFQSESGSDCVCWPTAASTALCLNILLRPSVQSLAVAHVNISNPLRRQPYWYHPHVVQLSVIGHSQWLPHGRGTLYVRNAPSLPIFRRELKIVLFRSSFPDVIWQCTVLYLHARHSVLICHHVLLQTEMTLYGGPAAAQQ